MLDTKYMDKLKEVIRNQHQIAMEYCSKINKPINDIKRILIRQRQYEKKENHKIKSYLLKGIGINDDILKP